MILLPAVFFFFFFRVCIYKVIDAVDNACKVAEKSMGNLVQTGVYTKDK